MVTVMISFVLTQWIINDFEKDISLFNSHYFLTQLYTAGMTCVIINMKKLLDSDWSRAVKYYAILC